MVDGVRAKEKTNNPECASSEGEDIREVRRQIELNTSPSIPSKIIKTLE
jgi:hypothetical protein